MCFFRLIGEFLKRRNTSHHCLQFLHRVGLSLVTMSIRSDQLKMGQNFLHEVKVRKVEVENWARQRQVLEETIKAEKMEPGSDKKVEHELRVNFVADEFVEIMHNLRHKVNYLAPVDDQFLNAMKAEYDTASDALEAHLDMRPKLYDVSYDNIGKPNKSFLLNYS